ncbi:MAG: NADH-quinone oxidoreductase subunit N [Candidatus Adiutrix intracellularis]|jgi:NADH-quinone oxidoreductase subunit N|nr:NADH-quinone oxidoreductase subunit N [Candidatus Adiutrix intracellularis]
MTTMELNFNIFNLLPETALFLIVLYLFGATVLGAVKNSVTTRAVLSYLPILALATVILTAMSLCSRGIMFWGTYQVDGLSQFFKLLITIGFLVTIINARRQPTLEEGQRIDYFLFLAFSTWGLIFMASTAELVTIYLAMELASYSLYVIIPLRAKSKQAAEGGIKYILFGAAATALSLYGLSWILASQHTTFISELTIKSWSWAVNPMAVAGLSLFLAGLFYKLALFPFHFWAPDAYQGASNETATFVATLPKLGAVAVLVRLSVIFTPGGELTNLIAVLAALSITFGNLCALAQHDLKRMLGFSSVAHAGYILVGLVPGTPAGLAAASFYALAYLTMNLLCFWIISRIASDGRNLTYRDLNGLSQRSPWLALALTIAAISLVGLPPTVGFIGKLWLVTGAWGFGYNWLVIILCLNSAIAIFYYLSLVRHAYTEGEDDPCRGAAPDISIWSSLGAVILALAVVILGVISAPVFDLALAVGRELITLP